MLGDPKVYLQVLNIGDMQVQELLKEHKDLVGMLNAQFLSGSREGGKVRDALYRYTLYPQSKLDPSLFSRLIARRCMPENEKYLIWEERSIKASKGTRHVCLQLYCISQGGSLN